jgi:alkanesulfonate monooxygenase SsuD/methylene tetrahydromethanopterin reductase-like flavin-dependent oxidoreductase (luciferase family)
MSEARIGLYFDLWDKRVDGTRSSWSDIKKMAQRAEQLGFDTLALADRLHIWGHGQWECTTMLSAMAAVTSTITLETAVIRSIYRNPTLVAKIVDSVDEISAGRLVLGLGVGTDVGDNKQFGYPEDYRYSRFEEALQIIHQLLRTGRADFNGRFYQAENCVLSPRGPRPQGPSLLIAARGPKMMRLAARYADLWNIPIVPSTPDEWKPHLEALEEACLAEGRAPETLKKQAIVITAASSGVRHAGADHGDPISGEPEQIADRIRRFYDAGFQEVIIWPAIGSAEAVEELGPVVQALKS